MFDLFRSREKSVRYLLTALLVLVALSMVTYLIPGSGSDLGRSTDSAIAEIGGEPLTEREVRRDVARLEKQGAFPRDMRQQFLLMHVQQMINERALAFQARLLGFEVTDEDLRFAIRSIFPQLIQDGRFNVDFYRMTIERQAEMPVPEFEANLRKQILLKKLRDTVTDGVVVSPEEIEREFRRRNEKIKIEYFAIAPDKYRASLKPSPEELQEAFNRGRSNYQIPEKRNAQVLVIDEAKVAASLTFDDGVLRGIYAASPDRYRTPEQAHLRRIFLKTADLPKEKVAELEGRAEELLKQLRAGADFAELAKKNSEDENAKAKGGDQGWLSRAELPNVADVAFALKPNEISNVIKTGYSLEIVQLIEKRAAQVRTFEMVKDELIAERRKQLGPERAQKLADDVRRKLVSAPLQAEAIAREFGATFAKVEAWSAGVDFPAAVGPSPDLDRALAGLKRGEVTQAIESQPGGPESDRRLLLGVLTDILPPRQATLAEVQDEVRSAVLDQKTAAWLEQEVKGAAEAVKSGDFKQAAKTMGLEVKSVPEFTIEGAAEGLGAGSLFMEAFAKEAGAVVGPIRTADKTVFARVVEKMPADMNRLAAERQAMLDRIKGMKAGERRELLEDSIVSALVKAGKVKIHQDAIQRLLSSYQGQS